MTKKAKKLGVKITPKIDSAETSCDTEKNNEENEEKEDPKEELSGNQELGTENAEVVNEEITKLNEKLTKAEDADNVKADATNEDEIEQLAEQLEENTLGDEKNENLKTSLSRSEKENTELHKVCKLLDKLTLEMLVLIEQQMKLKLKIESCMTEGEANLAKSRFIMGHKNVSSLQLPTENCFDIDPIMTVEEVQDDITFFGQPRLKLIIEETTKTPLGEDKDKKYIPDPLNWFGVLVPRNLHQAQNAFKNSLEVIVDCANNQTRLHQVCSKIYQLREVKKKLMEQ